MWNRKKLTLVIVVIVVLLLLLDSCTASTLSSCTSQQLATQSEDTSSADDSTASEAEDPQQSSENIKDLQAQIDELNQQIADKDAQIQSLQNSGSGDNENGGITFQEFLNLYFWSDGNTYRLSDDRKLYSNYACTKEYELNAADYTFPCERALQINMDSGLSVSMLMTTDGQIVWSPSPYFNRIDG